MTEFNLSDEEQVIISFGDKIEYYKKEKVKEFIKREGELCWKLYKKEIDFGKFWVDRIKLIGGTLLEEQKVKGGKSK